MVVIRLSRAGSKNRPFYHVVVADKRSPRDGRFIEQLGFYNPIGAEHEANPNLRIALDRLSYWVQVGAQVSPTVGRLVRTFKAKIATAPATN